ncbi:conjugal transfer protein MobC [Hymenobacter sp. GOD-10R]|uniref:conjugal transfer protein MobC n=1 Tax=Hymenobacter sp. GOD-10R TaxID=3093922 RepID=UPI002D77D508|nr:conjugal transfer protein MobC [Hymenobacter sp. GOD-10R]WRQ31622.1 conjugal transfer protein MobC [Hymenobacter sp. GOD-10R]
MEDEKGLRMIINMTLVIGAFLVVLHLYYYCYGFFIEHHLTAAWVGNILTRFSTKTALFRSPYITKGAAVLCLAMTCFGTRGKPDDKQTWPPIIAYLVIGSLLFFGNVWVLDLGYSATLITGLYASTTVLGFLLMLRGGIQMSRMLSLNLRNDIFNTANESFPQEQRYLPNEHSVNIPTTYWYQGKRYNGWINIVNPFRATVVYGTPGSGKSYAVIIQFIKQHIAKGFALYVYDYKIPSLTLVVYNELLKHQDKYAVPVQFFVIDFDNPRKSHRGNPVLASMMTDIVDATEAAATIMLNLNRTWIPKQDDFFVKSPINFVAAIIWFLKLYEGGKYCTFPHTIEFLARDYQEMFPILGAYEEIENYVKPFVDAYEDDAMEQLSGQIASARIALAQMASPALYWVMSGNDFTLDINNPEAPKVVCVGNNPKRKGVYGAALGLFNSRLVSLINTKGKLKSSLIIDELPTMYFRGLDSLIAEARSNLVSTCLGIQTQALLDRDYGKLESTAISELVGNVISGQLRGASAKALSENFGQIVQQRQGVSINSKDTSSSISTQMGNMIPASTITNLSQGTFVGAVADNFGQEIPQKVFHAQIVVDVAKIKKEEAAYQQIPDITSFIDPVTGEDRMDEVIQQNYRAIKNDIATIVKKELDRIADDTNLQHLIKTKKVKA